MLCDIVVLYVLQKRYFYREKKYQYVEDMENNHPPGYQVVVNCAMQRIIIILLLLKTGSLYNAIQGI